MSQTRTRNPLTLILVASLAVGAGVAFASPSAHASDKACFTKNFKYKEVKEACAKGGVKEVKKLMKGIQKGKAKSEDWKCTTCHEKNKEPYKLNGSDESKTGMDKYLTKL